MIEIIVSQALRLAIMQKVKLFILLHFMNSRECFMIKSEEMKSKIPMAFINFPKNAWK